MFRPIVRQIGYALLLLLVFFSDIPLRAQDNTPTPTANDLESSAVQNVANGDYEAALTDLNQLLENPPPNRNLAPTYNLRGDVHDTLGEYDLALADYGRALEIDPDHGETYYDRGYAEFNHGDLVAAAADWHQAQLIDAEWINAISPHLDQAWSRAQELGDAGNYEEAIRHLTLVLDSLLNPDIASKAIGQRMIYYYELGMADVVILETTHLVELDPVGSTAYLFRGLAYSNSGEYLNALDDLREYARLAGDEANQDYLDLIVTLETRLGISEVSDREQASDDWIIFQSDRDGPTNLYVMASDGTNQRPLPYLVGFGELFANLFPHVSPDGTGILYTAVNQLEGTVEVMVYDTRYLTTGVPVNTSALIARQLTRNATPESAVAWSPDGRQVLYLTFENDSANLFVMAADGSNARQLTQNQMIGDKAVWSPDGSQIAFQIMDDEIAEIYLMAADGTNIRQVTDTGVTNNPTTWMPDGQSLLICSNRDGDFDIYQIALDGTVIEQITNALGNECFPRLSPDGTRIVFFHETGDSVDVVVMDADGTHWHVLTDDSGVDLFPDWLPAPAVDAVVEGAVDTPAACQLTANRNANLRNGPGTNYGIVDSAIAGAELEADGQHEAADGYTWWLLDSGAWVREDLVTTSADCAQLPARNVVE